MTCQGLSPARAHLESTSAADEPEHAPAPGSPPGALKEKTLCDLHFTASHIAFVYVSFSSFSNRFYLPPWHPQPQPDVSSFFFEEEQHPESGQPTHFTPFLFALTR